jgi:hypothetical protein
VRPAGPMVSCKHNLHPRWRTATSTLVIASSAGGFTPIHLFRLVNAYSQAATALRLGLGRGTEVLLSRGSGHQFWLWMVGFATIIVQTFGRRLRLISASGCCSTAGLVHSGGICGGVWRPWARFLLLRTAPWETQWGQLNRSRVASWALPGERAWLGVLRRLPAKLVAFDSALF